VKSGIVATIERGLESPEIKKITTEVHLNRKNEAGKAEITVIKIKSCHLAFPKFPRLLSLADGTNTTIALPMSASDVLFVNSCNAANNTTAVNVQIRVVISEAKIAVYASGKCPVAIAISRGRIEI